MTFISVVVAVLATLVGGLLIYLGVRSGIWIGRRWRKRKEGWWRVGSWAPCWTRKNREAGCQTEAEQHREENTTGNVDDEHTPLLA